MSVILSGRTSSHITSSVAEFFLPDRPQSIYTYEAVQSNDVWHVGLNSWGENDRASIPVNAHPTLLNMTFDLRAHTANGTCTFLRSPGSLQNTTISCMQSTFTDLIVPVNVTSSVPLVTQSGPDFPANTTNLLVSERNENVWPHGEPYMRIRLDDVESWEVVRTAGQDPFNCHRLKVCVNGIQRAGRRDLVAAEALTPLGLMLIQHAQYATTCGDRGHTTTFPR